jgi:thiosulfate dehydrogenase [quinone] large subunit
MGDEKLYSHFQLSTLVLLRVLIGWHFLYEGIAKLIKPGWSAAGYLLQSKWIFSGIFHWMANNETVILLVNMLNIWGLILIGFALMVGLLSRFASIAGIALILLYYLCNPPLVGLYYAIPSEGNYIIVNKNVIEMAALLVVFSLPTSQIIGLDYLILKLIKKSN